VQLDALYDEALELDGWWFGYVPTFCMGTRSLPNDGHMRAKDSGRFGIRRVSSCAPTRFDSSELVGVGNRERLSPTKAGW
jgi:hypothetical protein